MEATAAHGSRHVAAAVAAALWRLMLQGESSKKCGEDDSEVGARLDAIRPCLQAQVLAARDGEAVRSASSLVPPDINVMANAAKHQFQAEFESLTPGEARREQRGQRSSGGNTEKKDRENQDIEKKMAEMEATIKSVAQQVGSNPQDNEAKLAELETTLHSLAKEVVALKSEIAEMSKHYTHMNEEKPAELKTTHQSLAKKVAFKSEIAEKSMENNYAHNADCDQPKRSGMDLEWRFAARHRSRRIIQSWRKLADKA